MPHTMSYARMSAGNQLYTGTWHTPLGGSYEGTALILFQAEDTATPAVTDETLVSPYLDLRAPWLAIHSPADGQFQGGQALLVSGAAEAYAQIALVAIPEDPHFVSIPAATTSDLDGSWQLALAIPASGRYTLQAQATDGAGNRSPVVTISVRVDQQGPAVTAINATPTYINPTVVNATTLAATIEDDLTGVGRVTGVVYDLPGGPESWQDEFFRHITDHDVFLLHVYGIPAETGEGQKYVDITAEDWVGNRTTVTLPAFVVDKTLPRVSSVALSASGSNLYLPGSQVFYYGPLSTGLLFVQANVDDTHPLTPSLAVAGIRDVTFPSLFQANDGGTLPGDGSPALSLTYVYTVTGSTYAGDGRIVSVSDRAGNTFSVPGSDPRHFVVYYDPAAPQFDSVS
ncbi:MAG: hypothetical protein ACOYYS_27255, partial [Chloroflexota bacterium]